MKIKQVEELAGISRKNIRFYEAQELLSPNRAENGYREYGLDDVRTLKQIRLLRMLGVPIESIRQVIHGQMPLTDCLERQKLVISRQRESLNAIEAVAEQMQKSDDARTLETLDIDAWFERIERMQREGKTFRDPTTTDVQRKKLTGAWIGAGSFTAILLIPVIAVIWANGKEPLPLPLLWITIALPLAAIIGLFVSLYQRIREIKGGEEDEAAQY